MGTLLRLAADFALLINIGSCCHVIKVLGLGHAVSVVLSIRRYSEGTSVPSPMERGKNAMYNRVVLSGTIEDVLPTSAQARALIRLAFSSGERDVHGSEILVVVKTIEELQRGSTVLVSGYLDLSPVPRVHADALTVLALAPGQWSADPEKRTFRIGHWRKLAGGRRVFVSAHGKRGREVRSGR